MKAKEDVGLLMNRMIKWGGTVWLLGWMSVLSFSQKSSGSLLDQANADFSAGRFSSAIEGYSSYLKDHPTDAVAMYQLGRSYQYMDRPDLAQKIFHALQKSGKKIPAEWYLTMGIASHENDAFEEADRYYRRFVKESDKNTDFQKVRYRMLQTEVGLKYPSVQSKQFVENLGSSVNSHTDEFGPVYSPNFDDKLYYTRRKSPDSLPYATSVDEIPIHEMIRAEIRQGTWKQTGPLDPALAGSQSQILLDFAEDGQKVLFQKQEFTGGIHTYYHFSGAEDRVIPPVWSHPFYRSEKGDRDLMVIHDSAFLFSSDRFEGYGGYDLFVTYKRQGVWVLENMGPEINSPYDEITPFLAGDGRTLYFSSNSDKSMGGYDVFYSVFDEKNIRWSLPQNAGRPVNSGKDDTGFRISSSGSMAVFSSNRPGGYGGFDLYQVFLDPEENKYPREPVTAFYEMGSRQEFASSVELVDQAEETIPKQIIHPIYFGRNPIVVRQEVKEILDQALHFVRQYPHLDLVFHVFTEEDGIDGFSLFRPYLLLEPVRKYLEGQGVGSERMTWWIYRNQDLLSPLPDIIQPVDYKNYVQIELANSQQLPVRFTQDPDEEERLKARNGLYERWKLHRDEVFFSIRLLQSGQLLQGDGLRDEKDVMMEISGSGDPYNYYSGIFVLMEDAREHLRRIRSKGFDDAEIHAFYKGALLQTDQIDKDLMEAHPEIEEFIIYQQ